MCDHSSIVDTIHSTVSGNLVQNWGQVNTIKRKSFPHCPPQLGHFLVDYESVQFVQNNRGISPALFSSECSEPLKCHQFFIELYQLLVSR